MENDFENKYYKTLKEKSMEAKTAKLLEKEIVNKGVRLLDQVVVKYLHFSKTYKNAKEILEFADVEDKKLHYIISKMKLHNKDFAGLFRNLDGNNQRLLLEAFHIHYEDKQDPKYNEQKGLLRHMRKLDLIRTNNYYMSYWELFNFEIRFLFKWLLLAGNNNPETLLEEIDTELWNYYEVAKIENYGNAKNWGEFWLFLKNHNIKKRSLIVKHIITNPFNLQEMEIQFDVKQREDLNGKFQVNIILDGFQMTTIAMYNSDVESLIHKGILHHTRPDKSVDGAGILLTSKAYKTK